MTMMAFPVRLHLERANDFGDSPEPSVHQDWETLIKAVEAFAGLDRNGAEELAKELLAGRSIRLREFVLYAEEVESS
jgi:hypothetical protein